MPLTSQTLATFDRGDDFTYGPITLTIPAALTDPSTWTDVRLCIKDGTGATIITSLATPFQQTVSAAGVATTVGSNPLTLSSTGTGPWTATVNVPINQTQSLFLSAGVCTWQLDFKSSAGKPDTLIGHSTVPVADPEITLPVE